MAAARPRTEAGEVEVRDAPLDPGAELAAFGAGGGGAVVSFTGVVRGEGGLLGLEIEHWPGATEEAIAGHVARARARWALTGVRVVHRHGRLAPGEPIMMVLAAARHRAEAFAAAEFLMDFLKSRAPFWKREHRAGGAEWVPAREADEAALGRWETGRRETGQGETGRRETGQEETGRGGGPGESGESSR